MEIQKDIIFNGIKYSLMGSGKYYLSQSKSNKGRKNPKGLHVAIWEFYNKKKISKGFCIHHKDGNVFNNDISNLECLSYSEHIKTMRKPDKENQREHLNRIRHKASEWHKSKEGQEWHKIHNQKISKKQTTNCLKCGKEIIFAPSQKRKYCSIECAKIRETCQNFRERMSSL